MRKEYDKKIMLDALNTVSAALDGSGHIKMEFGDSTRILASGISLKIVKTIQSNNISLDEAETAIFDANFLIQVIKNLKGNSVIFEYEEGEKYFIIRGDHGKYKVNLFSEKIFHDVKFDNTDSVAEFKIQKATLSECINKTIGCCDKSETSSRPMLRGINISVSDGRITFQATDSYRLARKIVDLAFDGNDFDVTVPAAALKIVSSLPDDITIKLFHNKVQFVGEDIIIQSNLLDGKYPDISRLVPSEFTGVMNVDKDTLVSALNSTNIIKNDNLSIVKLDMSEEKVVISSFNQEYGEYSEELGATYTGKPLCISCSGSYLIDAVRTCDNSGIQISFVGEMRPFIIEDGTENEIHLCLPVRTFS